MRMKTSLRSLAIAAILLAAGPLQTRATVGYFNYTFLPGDNLFQVGVVSTPSDLNTLFSATFLNPLPDGTSVSLWNATTRTYDLTSTYSQDEGSWSDDFTLAPGTGARLSTGPNGLYLLGDKCPAPSSGSTLFLNVIGRAPSDGEQIIRLDAASQTYITSTYQALSATWSNPLTSSPGQAFFFNLGPVAVPEPSTAALALLGLALCGVNRRHRAQ
ncbi:MAG: PEP-CTERM sorting domain-containing protein [Verrucomicrobia bacterium]|nr:PEP-CTERM sorting domain-containing protein [Verrucomicrobiota bacterium]